MSLTLPDNPAGLTPVMQQYWELKQQHPDAVLLFRLGDFYEVFFDDAPVVAQALGIQLTRRNRVNEQDVPMCGIPWHQLDGYLPTLLTRGFRVALCEQMEDPAEARKRGAKAIVRREVTRVLTPGTLTEEILLDARQPNWLVAVAMVKSELAVAWLDVSTGEFQVQAVQNGQLAAGLAALAPSEVLISQKLQHHEPLFEVWGTFKRQLVVQADSVFHPVTTTARLQQAFGVQTLDSFGRFSVAETAAAGALLQYVELTQKGALPLLQPPQQQRGAEHVAIDAATRRNLEITMTMGGQYSGSLLSVLDTTVTNGGARLLRGWLVQPLTSVGTINQRLDAVEWCLQQATAIEALQEHLRKMPDIERILARLALGRASPRDVVQIRQGLEVAEQLSVALAALDNIPELLATHRQAFPFGLALTEKLGRALADEVPTLLRDGGFIRQGYHPQLDETRFLGKEGQRLIVALEARYRTETGVSGLKIRHNNIIGYHIEVNPKQADALKAPFRHRQSLANAARFTTDELEALQDRLMRAEGEALALEQALFTALVQDILAHESVLRGIAAMAALLDVCSSQALLARQRRYCRPVVDDSLHFHIEGGRHPVVETLLPAGAPPFVPNDSALQHDERLWLMTGPNMAGKSTFLRQNALMTLMAQAGLPVPATRAHIGVVDAVFSRVGAADDLAQGRSTFMVEMVETAAILHQATARSLVILDEIGRGTATYDGLSLAWAVLEYLHDAITCRTLFATHYHELTVLEGQLRHGACYTLDVAEQGQDIVFLHRVRKGVAHRSYGLFVARLAGIPKKVLTRAHAILQELEHKPEEKGLPLFQTVPGMPPALTDVQNASEPDALRETLAEVDINILTPVDALVLLQQLKRMV